MNKKELIQLRVLLIETVHALKRGAPQKDRDAIADALRVLIGKN